MINPKTDIDAYVQRCIGQTNGGLYNPLINKLPRYPIPHCPLPQLADQLLLDIGCNWGRWMLSASRKGYFPIGIDVKLDALQAARRIMLRHNVEGYVVAADLKKLPFESCIFDVVFSYSVIQHTHRQRAYSCVQEVHRVLKEGGLCMLQFPTKYGLGNFLRGTSRKNDKEDDYDSWPVRYYSIGELKKLFSKVFGNFTYRPDSYLGTDVQWSDIDILPWRFKPIVVFSEALKAACPVLPFLRGLADSVYVLARRNAGSHMGSGRDPLVRLRQATDKYKKGNLAVLDLLVCPATGGTLRFDAKRQELLSVEAGLAYPIIDGIPVLLIGQAQSL